jgi:hypothetical protein
MLYFQAYKDWWYAQFTQETTFHNTSAKLLDIKKTVSEWCSIVTEITIQSYDKKQRTGKKCMLKGSSQNVTVFFQMKLVSFGSDHPPTPPNESVKNRIQMYYKPNST